MDTNTPITTAARRIARDASSTPSIVTTFYDVDGRPVASWVPGEGHGDVEPYSTRLTGGPCTQRRAQDTIDAWAHAREVGNPAAANDYLVGLRYAR